MTITEENQIESNLTRVYSILNSEIFDVQNINHPLRYAAFIELSICLRDLAFKCEKYEYRINFDDDVIKTEKINDITDLIKHCRDACCHIDSQNRIKDDGGVFSFNALYGKTSLGGVANPYQDDICFYFGDQRIYLNRHIHRFLNEAVNWLRTEMSLLPQEWNLIFEKRNVC